MCLDHVASHGSRKFLLERDIHHEPGGAFLPAFGVEVVNRVALGLGNLSEETEPFLYMARLFSFLLILAAIVNKNRRKLLHARKTNELDNDAKQEAGIRGKHPIKNSTGE